MIIHYPNGSKLEGLLLSQRQGMLRVAAKGVEDALIFHSVSGDWITESDEPVRIELEWQRRRKPAALDRGDCIYSQELAERLVRILRASEPEPRLNWVCTSRRASSGRALSRPS